MLVARVTATPMASVRMCTRQPLQQLRSASRRIAEIRDDAFSEGHEVSPMGSSPPLAGFGADCVSTTG